MPDPGKNGDVQFELPRVEGDRAVSPRGNNFEKTSASAMKLLAKAIVFAALVLGGVALFAITVFGRIEGFLPSVIYGITAFLAWFMLFYDD